jgi:hypothetical protein
MQSPNEVGGIKFSFLWILAELGVNSIADKIAKIRKIIAKII